MDQFCSAIGCWIFIHGFSSEDLKTFSLKAVSWAKLAVLHFPLLVSHTIKSLAPKINFTWDCTGFLNWDSLHARLNNHYEAWSYKKKNHKKIKAYEESLQEESAVKRCLLILDLKPLRSYVKGKHSIGREFQCLAVRRKKLLR